MEQLHTYLIIYVVLSLFCAFLFDLLIVLITAPSLGFSPPLTPEQQIHIFLVALQWLPLCIGLGFLLSPLLVVLGKIFYG
ncbi:MAG: hypothetical protein ACFFCO_01760 [Promethearchaeota archaeon]